MFLSCSKELAVLEEDVFSGVGKWKIKKKGSSLGSKLTDCDVTDLILNSNLSFKIYTEDNRVLTGSYSLSSSQNIQLNGTEGNIGALTNIEIVDNNISFDINLEGVCQNSLEGDKDESYVEGRTYVADSNFENYLIEQGIDDIADNFVLTSKIISLEKLNLNQKNITSLVGIEDFIGLEGLSASENQISGILDLSNNSKLVSVDLPTNPIKELHFNNNPSLEMLWVYNTNTLEKLEISNSPNLLSLSAHNNKLEELDLSNFPKLYNLRIWDSNLKKLDLSLLTQLEYLVAGDVLNDSDNGEVILPIESNLKVLALGGNRLNEIINLSTSVKLERADLNDNFLTEIDFSNNRKIEYLSLEDNQITQLNVSNFENLIWFRANGNQISCVTVSETQINAIPPSCIDLGIPNSTIEEEESCYDKSAWMEDNFAPEDYEISSTWVVDDGTFYSLDCN